MMLEVICPDPLCMGCFLMVFLFHSSVALGFTRSLSGIPVSFISERSPL